MHEKLCSLKTLLRSVSRLEESIRASYGVTLTEALCLCSIGGGCTAAGGLGAEVALSPSRLSRVLGSLERKGLIERARGTEDKRIWNLALTAEGMRLMASMRNGEIELPDEIAAWRPNNEE